jgi:hypothetical protein
MRRLRAPFFVSDMFTGHPVPRNLEHGGTMALGARFHGNKGETAMQTGFFEMTMLAVVMLSSMIWMQPF